MITDVFDTLVDNYLDAHRGLTAKELAARLDISESLVRRALDQLFDEERVTYDVNRVGQHGKVRRWEPTKRELARLLRQARKEEN